VGAVDVLMLDVAKILQPSRNGFNTVHFFDRTNELVTKTRKSIPGANGFPGDFISTVLMQDPVGEESVENLDPLAAPENLPDSSGTWNIQRRRGLRQSFISAFPFDIINLDLEEFLFKPNEPVPGQVINAFRKLFEWQRKPLSGSSAYSLDGFSLMFTTQIGPPNISAEYLDMLTNQLATNIRSEELLDCFKKRTGLTDVIALRDQDFECFFKLALPKVLAQCLMEEDWYIDPTRGIMILEIERQHGKGTYKMLHLVMEVNRKIPPRERRAPGEESQKAEVAYKEIVRQVFTNPETKVTKSLLDKRKLQKSLEHIKSRRKKYLASKMNA